MHRRRVLEGMVPAGVTLLAGCTGDRGTAGESGTDEVPTESSTPAPDEGGDRPRITARSFTRTGDAGEPGEAASVAFDDEAVTVWGIISGRNSCMQASLGAIEYAPDTDELRVRVETIREGGGVCTQQIVYRGYEAVAEFAGGLPTAVVVEYESMGDVRTVTAVTR
ncbi:hypothetical protein [Halobaculum gomorrense]|uniref:Uncharacterized protein n=1 Tax=Halobaculum gomorrense TaxID=43928 RepID=A0A1M5KA90_9EURY|nr:hypothetical protein [Halobaculum gomorrense]SHG49712.1 hypothetical protein SAMN05443636_0433 [Halobaculum gomorrense]